MRGNVRVKFALEVTYQVFGNLLAIFNHLDEAFLVGVREVEGLDVFLAQDTMNEGAGAAFEVLVTIKIHDCLVLVRIPARFHFVDDP